MGRAVRDSSPPRFRREAPLRTLLSQVASWCPPSLCTWRSILPFICRQSPQDICPSEALSEVKVLQSPLSHQCRLARHRSVGVKGPGSETTHSRLYPSDLRTKLISAACFCRREDATFPPHVLTHSQGHGWSRFQLCPQSYTVPPSELMSMK